MKSSMEWVEWPMVKRTFCDTGQSYLCSAALWRDGCLHVVKQKIIPIWFNSSDSAPQ
jgi:hypothetical protein